MSETLSTEALPAKQRLPFWIDMICQTYVQLECDAPNRDAFSGSIVTHRLPGLDLSVVSSRAQRVMHPPPGRSAARLTTTSSSACRRKATP